MNVDMKLGRRGGTEGRADEGTVSDGTRGREGGGRDTGHGTRDTGHGTRDTGHGTRDGTREKVAFIGDGFHRGLLVWLCLPPSHPPLWNPQQWGDAEGGPPLLLRLPKAASLMVEWKAAYIDIQVIHD